MQNSKFALLIFSSIFLSSKLLAKIHIQVYTEDWPPYNYANQYGEIVGKSTDVVKQALEAAGFSYTIELRHWAKAMELAENNANTLVYTIYRIPAREQRFKWICPIVEAGKYVIFRHKHNDHLKVNNIQDLKGYKTSIIRGDASYEHLSSLGFIPNQELYVAFSNAESIRNLVNKRVDFIVDEQDSVLYQLDSLQMPKDILTPILTVDFPQPEIACMAFGLKTSDSVVKLLRQAFTENKIKSVN